MQDLLEQITKLHRVLINIDGTIWDKQDLCGACAFSAYLTYKIAKKLNYEAKIYMTDDFTTGSHCWCIVEGKVIDATATQFPELEEHLDENDLLITDNTDIYKCLTRVDQPNICVVDTDTEFVSLTSNWSYQSVSNCLSLYSEVIKQHFNIDL